MSQKIIVKIPAVYKGASGIETPVVVELNPEWEPHITEESMLDADPKEVTLSSKTPGAVFSLHFNAADVNAALDALKQEEEAEFLKHIADRKISDMPMA